MNDQLRLGRALKLFDDFIRDWVTIESHAHLLDNDNNAAERVRQAIRDASASLRRPLVPITDDLASERLDGLRDERDELLCRVDELAEEIAELRRQLPDYEVTR